MADRVAHIVQVVRRPSLGRLLGAFGLFSIAENGTWLAVTVFAFQRGGVTEAGAVAVVQLIPAMVVAPLAAYAGDRFREDRVLMAGYAAQGTTMLVTAAAMASDAAGPVVYGAATAVAIAVTFTRPAMGALLPAVTRTPAELTAGNVLLGVLENLGVFLGPAVAGLLMIGGQPATVFAVMGGAMALAAVGVGRLPIGRSAFEPEDDIDAGVVAGRAWAGFRALGRTTDVRLIVIVLTINTLVVGAVDVLVVAVADEVSPGSSADRAGWFAAAFGLGALTASFASVALVGRSRLATALAVCVVSSGAALSVLGLASSSLAAMVLFAVCGAGESIGRITGATLVQRIAPSAVLTRIFGIVEGLAMAGLAGGAIGVSLLVDRFGLTRGLLVLAAGLTGLIVLYGPRLLSLDRRTPQPRPELVELVRRQEVFSLLPAPALERLLASLEPETVAAGAAIVTQGARGDRFYLIESGQATVTVDGQAARTLAAGDSFGEIALVRDTPRTATVVAAAPTVLQSLQRERFLAALGGSRGLSLAQTRSDALLAEDAERARRVSD